MEIQRPKYLSALITRRHNGFVKVITGIRRAGKSYLMNTLFYRYLISDGIDSNHIIRFAFDSADDLASIGEDIEAFSKRKVDPMKFMDHIKRNVIDDDMYYLLLDEVQRLESFEAVLNGYLRKPTMDIYVTGSNSRFLSSDILTEFEGRGDEFHVFPLAFSEFFSAGESSVEKAFDDYMTYGDLPAIVSMKGINTPGQAMDSGGVASFSAPRDGVSHLAFPALTRERNHHADSFPLAPLGNENGRTESFISGDSDEECVSKG
jgi:predicted AAA+ superfamily ATPase